MSESQLYALQCELIAAIAAGLFLVFVVRRVRRRLPGLAIGKPIAIAFGIRIAVAFGIGSTTFAGQLRGGDEATFLSRAISLSHWSFVSTGTWKGFTHQFHAWFFSLNYRMLEQVPQMMLRIEVIGIAVAGLALLAAAVYELAGSRPAMITAWVLAFEPANIFFSGILHKEPFMMLAEGLVAYGGAVFWKRGDFRALLPMVTGCLLATATRPYVGWFLAAAAAFMTLHASLRRNSASSSFALAAIVVALMVAFFPTVWNVSSKSHLKGLQASQDANATNTSANLSLERVDYSTRGKIFVNLPKRILDIATKPYPWQLGNKSQQLGLLGTMFLFVGMLLLIPAIARAAGQITRRAGPLLYPALFLLVAYALSAGNAGTAFRYRTHLVAFMVALIAVLRARRRVQEPEPEPVTPGRLHLVMPVRSQTT